MTFKLIRNLVILVILAAVGVGLFLFLQQPEPVLADRYIEPDKLFDDIEANIASHADLEAIVDIDHSRLGSEAGSPMPPSHVLIFSDPSLDAAIIQENPVAAIDLPMRVLVYEEQSSGKARVISNSYDFVAQRHSLPDDDSIRSRYDAVIAMATEGIPDEALAKFPSDKMESTGLITLTSPFDFSKTVERVTDAINSQGDTVVFDVLGFSERLKASGVSIEPMQMILFGGPGPGGKAMLNAPTLGLDAFCQKLLIWQDEDKTVRVAFNDLLALADRQGVPTSLPLRVINYRLNQTFSTALEE